MRYIFLYVYSDTGSVINQNNVITVKQILSLMSGTIGVVVVW